MFIDTHCHLYNEYYDNIEDILKLSQDNNVNYFINNGTNAITNKEVLDLCNRFNNIYGALGIHPEDVDNYNENDIDYIRNNLTKKIVAIGEIGLDYYYTKDNKEEQIILFRKMLDIASEYNLPVIIHSREATKDTLDILKEYNLKGVIHSFSGSLETAKEYIKLGYLLGVNGVITFKNSNIKEVYKEIPLDKIVLETDSPYLTPEPFRGRKNNPSHIIDIAKFISELKGISLNELSLITNNNVKKLYRIDVDN